MRYILLFLLYTATSFAIDMSSLPIHSIEADKVHSESGKIHLEGSVKAVLDLGTVTCEKATLHIAGGAKDIKVISREIELENHVDIHFTDGSILKAHKGVIDCEKRVGTFSASQEEKVVYDTQLDPKDDNSHVRATSNHLVGKLVRTDDKWKLDDLNAEGSVRVEYLPKELGKDTSTVPTAENNKKDIT